MLEQAQSELNLKAGEFAMFVPFTLDTPPQSPAIVIVAQTNQVQPSANGAAERIVGGCEVLDNRGLSDGKGKIYPNGQLISIGLSAAEYFRIYEPRNDISSADLYSAKFTILQQPKHGTFEEDKDIRYRVNSSFDGDYIYTPDIGYFGDDSVSVLVGIKGIKVKVVYFFHMLNGPTTPPLGREMRQR